MIWELIVIGKIGSYPFLIHLFLCFLYDLEINYGSYFEGL